jgi:voltage-gated potassium channel
MNRWERLTELPLAIAAAVFLGAYAWPILDPGLGRSWSQACEVTVWAIWLAFAVDYAVRLAQAADRRRWFIRHLLDLVVIALPLLRPLRLLRLVTMLRFLNRSASSSLRGRVVVYVGAGSALLAFVAALAMLDAERDSPGASITSFGDALWWACTTMATVGYGDQVPVTTTGRFVAVGLMVAGIALLGTVTATLASWLVEAVAQQTAGAIEESPEAAELLDELARLRVAVEQLTLTDQQPR